jgi:hypothetical protein
MKKDPQSVDSRLLKRIQSHSKGWVFTPSHFSDLGSRAAVASALKRYKKDGTIRQIARGLYDIPRYSKMLGKVASPDTDAIANALKGRDAIRLQPTGAYAANILGLSTQVPVKIVFLTDGPSRRVQVGRRLILLKRTTPRNMATAGRISGTVIQGLRWLGQRHVEDAMVRILRQRLPDDAKKQLLKDVRYAPAWIADIMRQVGGDVSQ